MAFDTRSDAISQNVVNSAYDLNDYEFGMALTSMAYKYISGFLFRKGNERNRMSNKKK